MVCKEDVLSWFKDLESYKRIDLMRELLNMCMPFEVRFVGTCVEEIGKHAYQELRGLTLIANDVEKLSKDTTLSNGLLDECTRSRALLYISLLTSRNCSSADWMFKTLFRTEVFEEIVVNGGCKDESLQSELLVLLTMGVHHPAFTFDQKSFFSRLLEHLVRQKEGAKEPIPKMNPYCLPPGFAYPSTQQPHIITSPSDLHHLLPNKPGATIGHGEAPPYLPPGIPIHNVPPPNMWRTPYPAGICLQQEVPPLPPPSLSPIGQSSSPLQSRANSPHRGYTIRAVTGIPLTHGIDLHTNVPQANLDSMSSSSLLQFVVKEDENHMHDEKMRDPKWVEGKALNGMIPPLKEAPGYYCHQMHALKLEGENSLHCSTSSSNSSLNQSPPPTPTAVAPHGPGRGLDPSKHRSNGMPSFMGPPPAVCDTPPLPGQFISNVPFTNFSQPPPPQPSQQQPHPQIQLPPRCYFQYTQPLVGGPFTTPAHFLQHISVISSPLPPLPPRNPNCYNCGAIGHNGPECTAQTIEDITQKPYEINYAPPMHDGEN